VNYLLLYLLILLINYLVLVAGDSF